MGKGEDKEYEGGNRTDKGVKRKGKKACKEYKDRGGNGEDIGCG